MGLSLKPVSNDHGIDWSQALLMQRSEQQTLAPPKPALSTNPPPQQPPERLNCPRCDSTNTKFCYYNNYNKLQPRHFCKACKRHWTKGGTLRNVPVGGGRKNRRSKTTKTGQITKPTSVSGNTQMRNDHQSNKNPNFFGFRYDQNSLSVLNNNMMNIPPPVFVLDHQKHQTLRFPFPNSSSSCSFEKNPPSISSSFDHSSTCFSFNGEITEDPRTRSPPPPLMMMMPFTNSTTTTTTVASTGLTSNIIDEQILEGSNNNYLNWDDIDNLVSTQDLNIHWDDDSDINMKP